MRIVDGLHYDETTYRNLYAFYMAAMYGTLSGRRVSGRDAETEAAAEPDGNAASAERKTGAGWKISEKRWTEETSDRSNGQGFFFYPAARSKGYRMRGEFSNYSKNGAINGLYKRKFSDKISYDKKLYTQKCCMICERRDHMSLMWVSVSECNQSHIYHLTQMIKDDENLQIVLFLRSAGYGQRGRRTV